VACPQALVRSALARSSVQSNDQDGPDGKGFIPFEPQRHKVTEVKVERRKSTVESAIGAKSQE